MKKSTCISSVDVSGSDLILTFAGGRTYGYRGAASHAKSLQEAPSAGGYDHANIKDKFQHCEL